MHRGVKMNFEFINGKLVDTDADSGGLGTLTNSNSTDVTGSSYTPTVSSPNKYTNMAFGITGDNTTSATDYTPPASNSIFGDLFGKDGFGMNKGTMEGLGSIGGIGAGIGKIWLGSKQLGLAEDKFEFDKNMLNKQYDMAKDNYDRQKARAESVGNQMQAGKVG